MTELNPPEPGATSTLLAVASATMLGWDVVVGATETLELVVLLASTEAGISTPELLVMGLA